MPLARLALSSAEVGAGEVSKLKISLVPSDPQVEVRPQRSRGRDGVAGCVGDVSGGIGRIGGLRFSERRPLVMGGGFKSKGRWSEGPSNRDLLEKINRSPLEGWQGPC